MRNMTKLVRGMLLAAVLLAVVAGAGYGAAGGSQTVSVAAAARIDITVPASASIASTAPGACGTTSTLVNVKTNKPWNLQVQSDAVTYPNGKAKNGLGTEMVNAFQYKGGDVAIFTNISSSPANLYLLSQPKTASQDVTVDYQQCVDWLDSPDTYTIVVQYLGINP